MPRGMSGAGRFRAVAKDFKWLVVSVSAFTALYWGAVAWHDKAGPQRVQWRGELRFEFPQVVGGRYPSGRQFAANDLLSRNVLGEVVSELGLTLDVAELAQLLSVFTPDDVLRETYDQARMQMAEAASETELESIRETFIQQVRLAVRSEVRLSLITDDVELPGERILRAIPEAWARLVKEDSSLSERLPATGSSAVVRESMLRQLDCVLAYDRLYSILQSVEADAERLAESQGLGPSMVRSTSGLSLADISIRAERLREIDLELAIASAIDRGFTERPQVTTEILRDRVFELRQQSVAQNTLADSIEQALIAYSASDRAGARRQVSTGGTVDSPVGDVLDRLIQFGQLSEGSKFREDLSRRALNHRLGAARFESDAQRIQAILDRLSAGLSSSTAAPQDESLLAGTVQRELERIGELAAELFDAVNEIRLSAEAAGPRENNARLFVWTTDIRRDEIYVGATGLRVIMFTAGLLSVLAIIVLIAVLRSIPSILRDSRLNWLAPGGGHQPANQSGVLPTESSTHA